MTPGRRARQMSAVAENAVVTRPAAGVNTAARPCGYRSTCHQTPALPSDHLPDNFLRHRACDPRSPDRGRHYRFYLSIDEQYPALESQRTSQATAAFLL